MALFYPETHEVDLWQVQYRSIASDTVNGLKFNHVNRTFTVYFSNIRLLFLKQKIIRKNIKIIVFQPFQFQCSEDVFCCIPNVKLNIRCETFYLLCL